MTFTFKKSERIYKRDEIQALFKSGKSFNEFPFRVLHLKIEKDEEPVKIAVSIPKRRFKKAVDRNLLKRRTKEAYRTNKTNLRAKLNEENFSLTAMFIYIGNDPLPFKEIEDKINLILLRLESIYGKDY